MFKDKTYKRCSCRGPLVDKDGKPVLNEDGTPKIGYLERRCPKLKKKNHGSWYYAIELPPGPGGVRRRPKEGGFATQEQAAEKAKRLYEEAMAGVDVDSKETVADYLTRWLANNQQLKRTTHHSYESYLPLYYLPHLGHIKLRDLRTRHIQDMFAEIKKANQVREANQQKAEEAREAERAAHRAWKTAARPRDPRLREAWNQAKADLKAALARPRRLTGPATQRRIKMVLSSALEDARRQQLITTNWAALVQTPRVRKAKALVWTLPRVNAWARTGQKPSAVMVWTPKQTGLFLDEVIEDRLYPLWHLITFHGLRRGEACALPWSEVEIDRDRGVIHITEEIVTVAYEPHEDTPKSDNIRDISLDKTTTELLRRWRNRQEREAKEWQETAEEEYTDSGRVFTLEDGTPYHPQYFSDRFERLYKKAGLPPIRLHDLRHGSATLSLRAGVDMTVIQRRLGHSSIRVTSDIYTSVLEEVETEAAEATVSVVPRSRPTTTPSATAEEPDTERRENEDEDPDDGMPALSAA